MDILQVITRSDIIGGASTHVLSISKRIKRRGHNVNVLCGGSGVFIEELEKMGLKYNSLEHLVRPIQPFEDLKAIFELGKKINKLDPDVVALHSAKAGVLGRIACWWDETPCVVTAHGWAFTEGKSRLRRHFLAAVERLVAPLAERIITVSDFDQKLAADWKVSSPEKMITIYNGVHDLRQKKVMSDEFNETPRIIMVARFELQKDQLTLLRALKKLRGVPWEAWFVGDGPRLEQCVDLARDLDIDDSVRFLGYRSDVPDLLAQSDIFVLSTHYEGFPIATVEAMRAGLPIVASDVGGVSEQVRSGKNGFLVPPEDVGELKRALEDLLQNKETRQEMGMAGRQMFCEQFRVEKMVDRTLEVYKEATRQGKQ